MLEPQQHKAKSLLWKSTSTSSLSLTPKRSSSPGANFLTNTIDSLGPIYLWHTGNSHHWQWYDLSRWISPTHSASCLSVSIILSCQSGFLEVQPSPAQVDKFMTFTWQWRLHDWYLTQTLRSFAQEDISWPLVFDANDIIAEEEAVVRYFEIMSLTLPS